MNLLKFMGLSVLMCHTSTLDRTGREREVGVGRGWRESERNWGERREKGEREYDKINKLHKPLLVISAFY